MFLLDTHALVWAIDRPELLSPRASAVIQSEELMVSTVSFWELLLKKGSRGAPLKNPGAWWQKHVTLAGVQVLPIQPYHLRHLETLPPIHKDPFDRVLICQSLHHQLSLVTNDEQIRRYGDAITAVW